MKKWHKVVVVLSGIIVGNCAAAGMVFLFNKPGIVYKICGVVAAIAFLVLAHFVVVSLED